MGGVNTTQGNEFDGIPDFDSGGVVSKDGFITEKGTGTPYTGYVAIRKDLVPVTIDAAIKSLNQEDGVKVRDGAVGFYVVDGKIVSTETSKGFRFKRDNQALGQRRIDPSRKDEGPAPLGGNAPTPNKPAGKPTKNNPLPPGKVR
jgi:hypothetical protein